MISLPPSPALPSARELGYAPVAPWIQPGERSAHRRLRWFLDGPVYGYADDRNRPALDGSSKLSPHFRFGAISVRTAIHAALNTLLQGSGAIVSKKWMTIYDRRLTEDFGPQGWRGKWAALAWVHDENQIASRPSIAEDVGRIMVESIRAAGEHFNWRCPLDGEAKIGRNWKETH